MTSSPYLPSIENELRRQVARLDAPATAEYHAMLTYHMGWTGEGSGERARGKRVRPVLLLLTVHASGGRWENALPAAAAVELLHNFSLVHDDIQDDSDTRRGRATVWRRWGVPQAINAGDGLFVLSNLALADLSAAYPAETVVRVGRLLNETCLNLTRGQFLDMSYEKENTLPLEAYWQMIEGKTAALLSACTEIGAILGGASEEKISAYAEFGRYLGLAFQVQDDYLGIWGDSARTGKSTASDLVAGKKSFPILYALQREGAFSRRWRKGKISPEEVAELAKILEEEGARRITRETADSLTQKALDSLSKANPQGEPGKSLFALAKRLLRREA
jgi:geranylgeranyl diphosphate synthase type I